MNSSPALHVQAADGAIPTRPWSAPEVNDFLVELRCQLRAIGVFRSDHWGYVVRALWVLAVSAASWTGFVAATSWPQRLAMALLAGYAGVQASAIAHESGHGAVSKNRMVTRTLGHVFMTWLIGVSYSAWIHRHGLHHVHPNSRKDPDVRAGMFSFNEDDARKARGLAAFCTRHQHRILLPLSSLMGFTLKYATWRHVLSAPKAHLPDIFLLLVHVAIWLVIPAQILGWTRSVENFALLTWAEGAYLSFVFLANHLGRPTTEEAKAWPPGLRQIVTARNLGAGRLLSHLCIGLNTHIEHHLFGNLPTTRLCEAREITRRMCLKHEIPYRECTIREGFAEVQRYNHRMAMVARKAHSDRRAAGRRPFRLGA